MFYLVQLLVPIAICVVLPIMIVWLCARVSINKDNRNAEIILKAIESNSPIDTDKLVEALSKPKKTEVQILQRRLLKGSVFTLIGVALAIIAGVLAYNSVDRDNDTVYFMMFLSGISLAIGIGYLIVFLVTRKFIQSQNHSKRC